MNKQVVSAILLLFLFSCKETPVVQKPDSIQISVPYELDLLDPHAETRLSSFALLFNFYEPLVTTDAGMRFQPGLADRWENPDVYTWIFHLRPSVRFHSGKSMTSADVVYSYKRLMETPGLEINTYLIDVSEVHATGPLTVSVRTKSPLPIFLNKLSNVAIVPDGSTSAFLADHVDGTGPYKLEDWKKGDWIRMSRNEDYWNHKPDLKTATYYLNRRPEQAVQDLTSNRSQFAQYDSKKLEPAVQSLGKFQILRQDNYFLKYLSYDVSRDVTPYCSMRPNPFKNPFVRQAIQKALDRQKLVSGLPTFAVIADQPVPPFVFGFNPDIPAPTYDPTAARSLLERAGFPQGFEVTMHVRQILHETGRLIQEQLQRVGIRVTLKVLQDGEFFKALDKKDFTFFLTRVGATVGDASDVLEPQLHTVDVSRRYGVRNYIGYSNREVDRAIEDSASLLKVEDRRAVLQQIMTILMNDLPWIPLYIDQDVYAISNAFSWQPRHDSYVLAYEVKVR